jgi:hypothetical protein
MNDHVIRDCVVNDRLAQGLAEYYSRRTRGVMCPDLLPPDERAYSEISHDQRLKCARLFVNRLHSSAQQSA